MEDSTYHPLSIKKWAEEDRPREKLLLKGKAVLSEAELIGILIGSGTRTLTAVDLAKQILASVDHDLHRLAQLSIHDLKKFNGIGEAKAISIVSAMELGRRRSIADHSDEKTIIKSPEDLYNLMKPELLDLDHEEFWVIMLKRNNELIRKSRISIGGISGTIVDPKIVFKSALEEMASSLALVHNHPSGNMRPSQTDIRLTKKLTEAGKLFDLPIIDHIIFTNQGFYSFADESMM